MSHNKRAQWIFHFVNVLKDWSTLFMPPAWKVRRGHLVFGRPSVCPLFRPAYKQSAIFKVWMVSNQTWTASSPKGCLHLNDITCPLGDGRGQNVDFAIFCSPRGIRLSHTHLVLFALGNERTLVRCKSCEALLKDLHATSVLSFHNAKKSVLQSLYLC